MMRQSNKILVGCLALLLVLSVGYALFSDTITINGTATAKGEFDITATCQTGIPGSLESTAYALGINSDGGYANDSCEVVDDKVSLKTDFLYPGARRNFTVKITNTGTIDAVYDDSKVTTAEELCVADDLEGNNLTCNSTPDKYGVMYLGSYSANMSWSLIAMEDDKGNLLSQSEVLQYYDPNTGIGILKPGYSSYSVFSIFIDHKGVQSIISSGEMNVSYTATMELPFAQAAN